MGLPQKRTYTVVMTPDGTDGGFVGRCEELHANSEGRTYGETVENMKEAIEVSLDDAAGFDMLIVRNAG